MSGAAAVLEETIVSGGKDASDAVGTNEKDTADWHSKHLFDAKPAMLPVLKNPGELSAGDRPRRRDDLAAWDTQIPSGAEDQGRTPAA